MGNTKELDKFHQALKKWNTTENTDWVERHQEALKLKESIEEADQHLADRGWKRVIITESPREPEPELIIEEPKPTPRKTKKVEKPPEIPPVEDPKDLEIERLRAELAAKEAEQEE